MADHDPYLTRKLRDYAHGGRDIYPEDTSSERTKVMIAAADEIDQLRSHAVRLESYVKVLECRLWENGQ